MLDTWQIRRAPRVWLMAALFMVMIDMVVDPLSVLGERWFLGKIFWYDPPGPHFGVPISNYLGWYFVAAITIAIFQWLDAALNRGATKPAGLLPCAAIARAARSRALCGHRAVRHHDAVPNQRGEHRLGRGLHLLAVQCARDSYSDPARILGR